MEPVNDLDEITLATARIALYTAWTIIANAYEGNWDRATPEWRMAAERWRDEMFHRLLPQITTETELES